MTVTEPDRADSSVVLERSPSTDETARRVRRFSVLSFAVGIVAQAAVMCGALFLYLTVRSVTEADPSVATSNAADIIRLEQGLGLYHEAALQRHLASGDEVRTFFNWIYIWGYWPVIGVTLLWLYLRHRYVFRQTRNAMLLSGGIALFIYAYYPLTPPRLADIGMVDTITETSEYYRVLQNPDVTNQYAAMPSMHVGWILLMGLAIVTVARWWWLRAIGVLAPILMTVTVILTANHFVVDVIAGAALTAAAWAVCRRWSPIREQRPLAKLRTALQRA